MKQLFFCKEQNYIANFECRVNTEVVISKIVVFEYENNFENIDFSKIYLNNFDTEFLEINPILITPDRKSVV